MRLEAGRSDRAKTANGDHISFMVLHAGEDAWASVDLDSAEGPEPNVLLNTGLLLWISTEQRQSEAVQQATEQVIEALERSTGGSSRTTRDRP